MKYLVLILLFIGGISMAQASRDVQLDCVKVYDTLGDDIYRCENFEVVCYKYDGNKKGGLYCQFKRK